MTILLFNATPEEITKAIVKQMKKHYCLSLKETDTEIDKKGRTRTITLLRFVLKQNNPKPPRGNPRGFPL